jgi:8-oxo-dGTP diphosphatase
MKQFNIRVYGLLINELGAVLVSDERRHNISFTKFPGGGLEFGEGVKGALIREFQEELGIPVDVGDLFYGTDFFQVSAFNPDHQLISFYYKVHYTNWRNIEVDLHTVPLQTEGEKHRWIDLRVISAGLFTFPIDKLVAENLQIK